MLRHVWENLAKEQSLQDHSDKGKREFIRDQQRKTEQAKKAHMSIGQMIRLQEWFGRNKTVRAEVLPNWSLGLFYKGFVEIMLPGF